MFLCCCCLLPQVLLGAGADPREPGREGRTPLHCALSGPVVHALVSAGANVEAVDAEGQRSLHTAVSGEVVTALVVAGRECCMCCVVDPG